MDTGKKEARGRKQKGKGKRTLKVERVEKTRKWIRIK
jgi:hypothetical protein